MTTGDYVYLDQQAKDYICAIHKKPLRVEMNNATGDPDLMCEAGHWVSVILRKKEEGDQCEE